MAELMEKIRKLCSLDDINYIGVSPVSRFKNAPVGWRPNDLLDGCKNVISLGIRIGKGVTIANQKAYKGIRHGIYVYMQYGYVLLNDRLNLAALHVSNFLESKGYTTMPIPAGVPSDHYMLRGAFSHRHAAVAAGLGEFGWNGLFMTPDAGPRVRLVTILTEAELPSDPLYKGKSICNRKECNVCVAGCPANAINENEGVEIEIEGRVFEYARIDKVKCTYGLYGLLKEALGRQDTVMPNNPTPEDYLSALLHENPWQKMERLSSMCGKCLINCPANSR